MRMYKKIVVGFAAALVCSSLLAQNENGMRLAFSKSVLLEKNKDYQGAIAAVKEVDTKSYEANLRLGWLNYKAGFQNSSLTYYENAVNQMPSSIEAKFGYNYPAYELGIMDKVTAQYKKILELDPQNTQVLYNLGSIYYYKNDMKTALSYFEKIVALYPFGYDGLSMLAWTNLKLNKKAEATSLFEKVLLNVPSDKAAIDELTALKGTPATEDKLYQAFLKNYEVLNKPDYTTAIATLKGVYDKNSYEINVRLGWLNYATGLHKEAIAYYKTAIELKPGAIEPKLGIVYPLASLGNTNDLIDQYKAIVAIDPQNSTANYRLGYISYEKKEYEVAYKYFEKIVKLYPWGYDGLLMFAWTNFRLGKTEEAKTLFNKVLLYSSTDKSALEGLAMIK